MSWRIVFCINVDRNDAHYNALCQDLKIGNEVIWRYKGLPYTVKIKDVFGN